MSVTIQSFVKWQCNHKAFDFFGLRSACARCIKSIALWDAKHCTSGGYVLFLFFVAFRISVMNCCVIFTSSSIHAQKLARCSLQYRKKRRNEHHTPTLPDFTKPIRCVPILADEWNRMLLVQYLQETGKQSIRSIEYLDFWQCMHYSTDVVESLSCFHILSIFRILLHHNHCKCRLCGVWFNLFLVQIYLSEVL